MECPNCGARNINILVDYGPEKLVSCDCCLFEGKIVDKVALLQQKAENEKIRDAQIKALAEAEADERIKDKVKSILDNSDLMAGDIGEKVYEMCWNSVIEINADNSSGSGFIIGKNGYAVTNRHVVTKENGEYNVDLRCRIYGGAWIRFKVIKIFGEVVTKNDIALIKLDQFPNQAKIATFANSDAVKNGQQIFAIGNSLGRGLCIVSGVVSDGNRNGFIMHDAAVNPGNSGCPVFNRHGEVISVHTSGELINHVSFASIDDNDNLYADALKIRAAGMKNSIPANHVKKLILEAERNLGIKVF